MITVTPYAWVLKENVNPLRKTMIDLQPIPNGTKGFRFWKTDNGGGSFRLG
jgi:hypothetical protein